MDNTLKDNKTATTKNDNLPSQKYILEPMEGLEPFETYIVSCGAKRSGRVIQGQCSRATFKNNGVRKDEASRDRPLRWKTLFEYLMNYIDGHVSAPLAAEYSSYKKVLRPLHSENNPSLRVLIFEASYGDRGYGHARSQTYSNADGAGLGKIIRTLAN